MFRVIEELERGAILLASNEFKQSLGWTIVLAVAAAGFGVIAMGNDARDPLIQVTNGLLAIAMVMGACWIIRDILPRKTAEPETALAIPEKNDEQVPKVKRTSLLGPEDPELLERLGYHQIEFPELRRWERLVEDAAEPFEETEVLIAENGELVVDASVFNIHSQCAWQSNSASTFVYENGSFCDLSKILRGPKYQARLSLSEDVVYLGMESYLPSDYSCERHSSLSQCRYIELARRTNSAMPDTWKQRKNWGLDLGKAVAENPKLEFDQRRAVVVGIKERRAEVPRVDAIKKVVMSTRIVDVALSAYSASESSEPSPLARTKQSGYEHK